MLSEGGTDCFSSGISRKANVRVAMSESRRTRDGMSITSLRKHAVVWTHCQTWCSSTQTATGKSIAEESVHCWLQSHGALQRLEPHEVKISRSVLRGGWCSNAPSLPDWREG